MRAWNHSFANEKDRPEENGVQWFAERNVKWRRTGARDGFSHSDVWRNETIVKKFKDTVRTCDAGDMEAGCTRYYWKGWCLQTAGRFRPRRRESPTQKKPKNGGNGEAKKARETEEATEESETFLRLWARTAGFFALNSAAWRDVSSYNHAGVF